MTVEVVEVIEGCNVVTAEIAEIGAAVGSEVGGELGRGVDGVSDMFGGVVDGGDFVGGLGPEDVIVPIAASDLVDSFGAETGVVLKGDDVFVG